MTASIKKHSLFVAGLFVSILMLSGCSGFFGASSNSGQSDITTPLTEVSTYVSQIKSCSDTLSTKSDELTQAISNNDLVTIKLKRDEISDCLQKASEVSIPETIKSEGEMYVNACLSMKDILTNYTDIVIATIEAGSSLKDEATMQQLSEMQSQYDQAAKNFESADSAVNTILENLTNPGQSK